jgi:hypothetical protein
MLLSHTKAAKLFPFEWVRFVGEVQINYSGRPLERAVLVSDAAEKRVS